MPTIEVPQVSANDEITYQGTNAGPNAIANVVNGQLDDANIAQLSGTKLSAGTLPASKMTADANPETRMAESLANFIASGCVWSTVSGLNGAMTAGVAYVTGKRLTVAAVASKAFTASKDTYVYISDTGSVQYVEVANGAAQPATGSTSALTAKVVTGASAITSIVAMPGAAVKASKMDFKSGIWWEEIGRNTLTTAGNSLNIAIPAKRYIQVFVAVIPTGGTVGPTMTFNGDTGNNYSRRVSVNGGADSSAVSSNNFWNSGPNAVNIYMNMRITNIANQEKVGSGDEIDNGTAGAAAAPGRAIRIGKWANTTSQITTINVANSGTGNFAIGSEVVVLGHD